MNIDATVTAVVCGGASGLGAATVRALRAAGAQVDVLDRDVARGESLARDTDALFAEVSVSREDSVLQAFDTTRRTLGQERIVVYTPATGTASPIAWRDAATGQSERHSVETFNSIVKVNITGTFLCTSVFCARNDDSRGA